MFKKIFSLIILALSFNQSCNSMAYEEMSSEEMIIEMPNKADLENIFNRNNLNDFMEKTDIIDSLAGERKPIDIEIATKLSILVYCQELDGFEELPENKIRAHISELQNIIDAIINKILSNNPEAIEAIESIRQEYKVQI